MSNIKIQLRRSVAGRLEKHKKIVRSLGLRKLNQIKEIKDCPEVRGQVKKVEHLVCIVD